MLTDCQPKIPGDGITLVMTHPWLMQKSTQIDGARQQDPIYGLKLKLGRAPGGAMAIFHNLLNKSDSEIYFFNYRLLAPPIFHNLLNKSGSEIFFKIDYLLLASLISKSYRPPCACIWIIKLIRKIVIQKSYITIQKKLEL